MLGSKGKKKHIGALLTLSSTMVGCSAVETATSSSLGIFGLGLYWLWVLLSKAKASVQELKARSQSQTEELAQALVREANLTLELSTKQEEIEHLNAEAEQLARDSQFAARRFEELFLGLPVAAISFDLEGTIFEWNRACESLTGVQNFMAFGQSVPGILPSLLESEDQWWADLDALAEGNPTEKRECVLQCLDGSSRTVSWSAIPLRHQNGGIMGAIATLNDISHEVEMRRAVEQSEARLRKIVENLPAGAALVEDGQVWLNPFAERITGFTNSDENSVDDWLMRLGGNHGRLAKSAYKAVRESGYKRSFSAPVKTRGGEVLTFDFVGAGSGETEVWLFQDITEKIRSEEKFKVLFQEAGQALLVVNASGKVVDGNRQASKLLAIGSGRTLVGEELVMFAEASERALVRDFWCQASTEKTYARELHLTLGGKSNTSAWHASQIHLAGAPHWLIQIQDLTELRANQRAIETAYVDLHRAQQLAKIGSFEGNIDTGEFTWSPALHSIFGTDDETKPNTLEGALAMNHPEDFKKVRRTLWLTVKDGISRDIEHRIVTMSGEVRHVHSSVQKVDGEHRILGTIQDITEEKLRAEALASSEARLNTIVNSLQAGLVVLNKDLTAATCNENALNMMGIKIDASGVFEIPVPVRIIYPSGEELNRDDLPEVRAVVDLQVTTNMEIGYEWEEGRVTWYSVNSSPIVNEATGEFLGAVTTYDDITQMVTQKRQLEEQIDTTSRLATMLERKNSELKRVNTKLHTMAVTDGLTGLYNHRTFQERLSDLGRVAADSESPLSVILLDVDNFKSFNDTFGHPAGDKVLKAVGKILKQQGRSVDVVARYGGEEFVIALPGTAEDDALKVAERIRQAVASFGWTEREVTVSLGVSTSYGSSVDAKRLISEADQALYWSKRNGRNRAAHFQSVSLAA